jgi:hypothetical protein
MNRREFGKTVSVVAATAVVAPKVLSEPIIQDEYNVLTPEELAAIQRMKDNMPPKEIFERIAESVPFSAPNAIDKAGWRHGSCRIVGMIGGVGSWVVESGRAPKDIDLSDIGYVIFWRQAVRNKYSLKINYIASWTPCIEYKDLFFEGETTHVKKYIPIGTSHEETERMARESFLKLQEMISEYHNREE